MFVMRKHHRSEQGDEKNTIVLQCDDAPRLDSGRLIERDDVSHGTLYHALDFYREPKKGKSMTNWTRLGMEKRHKNISRHMSEVCFLCCGDREGKTRDGYHTL